MLCLSIKPTRYKQLPTLLKEAGKNCDLIEIRVDALPTIDLEILGAVIKRSALPVLLTLRSVEQDTKTLQQLATLQPAYLDVDHTMPIDCIKNLRKKHPEIKIVLSYHNYKETPRDLDAILKQMRQTPADFYKIATTAQNTLDALRVLLFSKKAGNDVIALAMGSEGMITRILAPVVGSPWSYAALSTDSRTAPGQLTVEQLQKVYNYSSLSKTTAICGLIGDPITFSIGDVAHNATYRNLGIDAVYVKMRVTPDMLREALSLIQQIGFRGLSVTIPLKERVQKYLSEIDRIAKAIGAVNTLTFSSDKIIGTNTDAPGALDAIEQHTKVKGLSMVIIGAGGAARAVAYEAKRRGCRVLILARRLEQAEKLGNDLGVEFGLASRMPTDYDILVNATPSELPIDEKQILPGTIVMDLKSHPKETALLVAASKRGCRCVYGVEMFMRQAEKQLQAWFGILYELDSIDFV